MIAGHARGARIGVLAVLVAVLAVGVVAMSGSDEADAATGDTFVVDGVTYTITGDSEVTASSYDSSATGATGAIPSTVTYEDVEYRVTNYRSSILDSGVTSIDLRNCTRLTTIGSYGTSQSSDFKDNTTLEIVYLPSSLTGNSAGTYTTGGAFSGCTSLKYVYGLADTSLTSMDYFFFGCTSLIYVDGLPSTVTRLDCTFRECTSLTTAPEIPEGVTDMGGAFMDCTSLTTAPEIPEGVTDMESTFLRCTSLAATPAIPSTVTTLFSTFRGCTSLTSLGFTTIPEACTQIGFVFNGCTSLTALPGSTSPISQVMACSSAFDECTAVVAWYQSSFYTPASSWYEDLFDDLGNGIAIYCSDDAAASFNEIYGDGKFVSVLDDSFVVDGLTYEITGAGEVTLTGYDSSVAGVDVTIPATVIYDNVQYMVAAVDASATSGPFWSSTDLRSITVESPYIETLSYLCIYCTSLESADLSGATGATALQSTFNGCTSLKVAPEIPSAATNVRGMFFGCTSLTTAPKIPDTATNTVAIFQGCTSLTAWVQDTVWTDFTGNFANMFANAGISIYIDLDIEDTATVNAAFGSERFVAPTVTFDANGGDEIATIDTGFTAVLPTTASREASDDTTYALAYFEASDGTIYEPGATVEDVRSLTMTARWYATTTTVEDPGELASYGSLVAAVPLVLAIGVVVAVIAAFVVRRDA